MTTEMRTSDPVTWLWSGQERTTLGVRATNCLLRGGIATIADLLKHDARDLMDLREFGTGCLGEVRRVLALHELELAGDVDWARR